MPCERVRLPGGSVAIVCGRSKGGKPYTPLCDACDEAGTLLCDWIIERGPDGKPTRTCDLAICATHALTVGDDKHLCPIHAEAWRWHPANKD